MRKFNHGKEKKKSVLAPDLSHYNKPILAEKKFRFESQTEQNFNSSLCASCVAWGKSLNFLSLCIPTRDNDFMVSFVRIIWNKCVKFLV